MRSIMEERRRFVRIPLRLVTHYKLKKYRDVQTDEEKESEKSTKIAKTKDISIQGIAFETEEYFPPASILEIELFLPFSDRKKII